MGRRRKDTPATDSTERARQVRERHQTRRRSAGALMPLADAADAAGLPYATMRLAVAKGLLPVVRIPGGRNLWIARKDLEAAIEAWKETEPQV